MLKKLLNFRSKIIFYVISNLTVFNHKNLVNEELYFNIIRNTFGVSPIIQIVSNYYITYYT